MWTQTHDEKKTWNDLEELAFIFHIIQDYIWNVRSRCHCEVQWTKWKTMLHQWNFVKLFIHFPPNVHLSTPKSGMNKTIGIDLKVKDLSEWMEMIVQAHSCGIHSKPSQCMGPWARHCSFTAHSFHLNTEAVCCLWDKRKECMAEFTK